MTDETTPKPDGTGQKQDQRRPDGKFSPGRSGNPTGRPKGLRNRATVLAETLIDEAAGRLTELAIEKAFAGDMVALKLVFDRLLPPRKTRTIEIDLPEIRTAADLVVAQGVVAGAMARGDIVPSARTIWGE